MISPPKDVFTSLTKLDEIDMFSYRFMKHVLMVKIINTQKIEVGPFAYHLR
jgi:hypothetical protein